MSGASELLLLARTDGDVVRLLSPRVGLFTAPMHRGGVLVPGEPAGVLNILGHDWTLVVPADVRGVVRSAPPPRVRQPVGYGDTLYELGALEDAAAGAEESHAAAADGAGPTLRAPQAGRFYHRPAPGAPPLVSVGAVLEEGTPVGLIEVMKTFAHVHYRATGGLPVRAKLVRMLVDDGGEVDEGTPLLAVEPAG